MDTKSNRSIWKFEFSVITKNFSNLVTVDRMSRIMRFLQTKNLFEKLWMQWTGIWRRKMRECWRYVLPTTVRYFIRRWLFRFKSLLKKSLDLQYCSMLENSKAVKSRNRRVVNGYGVSKNWDWIVRLEFLTDDSDLSSLCGGTVIHRYFILTAAHCCIGKDSVTMNFKEIKCK